MEIEAARERELIYFLLFNAYSTASSGLAHGKAGVTLSLFEAARKLKDEQLEDHAFELLQQAIVYGGKNISLCNGLSGIGFVLLYLIRGKLLDADYMELFGEQQQKIVKELAAGEYKEHQAMENVEMLLFLYYSAEYISSGDFRQAEKFLAEQIRIYYEAVKKKSPADVKMDEFYHCSALLMNVFHDLPDKDGWGGCVLEICHSWEQAGRVLENADLGFWLMEYEKNHSVDSCYGGMGKRLMGLAIENVVPQMMSLREKINLLYYVNQCDDFKHIETDWALMDKLSESWWLPSDEEAESGIIGNLPHCALYFGMGQGIARLVLLMSYWPRLQEREKLPQLRYLFY